jgi:hypothetical protein
MKNKLEDYNTTKHKLRFLWEIIKELMGLEDEFKQKIENLQKDVSSLAKQSNVLDEKKPIFKTTFTFQKITDYPNTIFQIGAQSLGIYSDKSIVVNIESEFIDPVSETDLFESGSPEYYFDGDNLIWNGSKLVRYGDIKTGGKIHIYVYKL